jgi:hypothetical protein
MYTLSTFSKTCTHLEAGLVKVPDIFLGDAVLRLDSSHAGKPAIDHSRVFASSALVVVRPGPQSLKLAMAVVEGRNIAIAGRPAASASQEQVDHLARVSRRWLHATVIR